MIIAVVVVCQAREVSSHCLMTQTRVDVMMTTAINQNQERE